MVLSQEIAILGWIASPGDYKALNYIINLINKDDISSEKNKI